MKAVILAGGLNHALNVNQEVRPKSMMEIGGRPILWHLMKFYSAHGVDDFIIALGPKSAYVKRYFLNFRANTSNLTIDLGTGRTTIHDGECTSWRIQLIDTGIETKTAGRLRRLKPWLENEGAFYFSHGDVVSDLDLGAARAFHEEHGRIATAITVPSPERFGRLQFENDLVTEFVEKPEVSKGWINGGFFILDPRVFDYLEGDDETWEREPIGRLTREGQLVGYRHRGFWSVMDTRKSMMSLEERWESQQAPWNVWS